MGIDQKITGAIIPIGPLLIWVNFNAMSIGVVQIDGFTDRVIRRPVDARLRAG